MNCKVKFVCFACSIFMQSVALSSCSDISVINQIEHDCNANGGNGNASDSTSKQKVDVGFYGNVNLLTTKAGTTPLQKDRNLNVYTWYQRGEYITTSNYFTNVAGELSASRNVPLSLFPGIYEFYAFSIGNKSMPLPSVDLETGFVDDLENGLDYLTTQLTNQNITKSTTLDLTLNHSCSQIIVNIVSGSATTQIDSVQSAQIQAPITTTGFLSVFTGRIPPVSTLQDSLFAMNVVNNSCNQILLPIKNITSLKFNFSVYVNSELTARNYTVKIPLVNSSLLAGSSYTFQVTVMEETVSIDDASVNNWVDVDETGNPLTPTPN